MAILKPDEIRDMSPQEIKEKINELELEISKEYGKIAVGGFPDNEGRMKEMKRTIARLKTIMTQEKEEQ